MFSETSINRQSDITESGRYISCLNVRVFYNHTYYGIQLETESYTRYGRHKFDTTRKSIRSFEYQLLLIFKFSYRPIRVYISSICICCVSYKINECQRVAVNHLRERKQITRTSRDRVITIRASRRKYISSYVRSRAVRQRADRDRATVVQWICRRCYLSLAALCGHKRNAAASISVAAIVDHRFTVL